MSDHKGKSIKSLTLDPRIKESRTINLAARIVFITFSIVLLFVGWAALAKVDEITKTTGEIIPKGRIQTVQHYDGGVVEAIYIQEGDLVKKDQVILKLRDIGINEDLHQAQKKQQLLNLEAIRLKAMIGNERPDYSNVSEYSKTYIPKQIKIYNDAITSHQLSTQVINEQFVQQKDLLDSLESKKKHLEQELKVANEIYDIRKKLVEKGNDSKLKMLLEEKTLIGLNNQYQALLIDIKKTKNMIEEYESKLQAHHAAWIDTLNHQLEDIENEMTLNNELINKYQLKKQRLTMYSPVGGIVKSLQITTVGQVVQPGVTIVEVLPNDTELVAILEISPKDIGYLQLNQDVKIKVNGYEHINQAIINGKLDQLSADSFKEKEGQPYYKGVVKIDMKEIQVQGNVYPIMSGMVVSADIITGQRTLLSYLLNPLYKSINNSFGER